MRNDEFAWAFIDASQQTAQHDRVGAGCNRLSNVARILYAAITYNGHAILPGDASALVDRGNLRHANPRYNARRTNRPGPNPNFDGVHTRLDQCFGRLSGYHVTRHQLYLPAEPFFHLRYRLNYHPGVRM